MPDRLSDERLEPQIARIRATIERIRQHEPAMADSLTRLLDAVTGLLPKLVALRRVAEAAEAVVSAQDERWRIGLKGEAERNGAIERLRSALAEWRLVRGE